MSYPLADMDTTQDDPDYPGPGGNAGLAYPVEDYDYLPGYVARGGQTTTADSRSGDWTTSEAYAWHGGAAALVTNPQVGAGVGVTNNVPFAYGGVSSALVENFELTGAQIKIRRPAASGYGPVGGVDFNSQVAAAVAQQSYEYPGSDQINYSVLASL